MISTAGKCFAASCANRCMSTAPIAKFGTTITLDSRLSWSSRSLSSSRSAGPRPVVPTTMLMAWSMAHRTLSITASGFVKSTMTSVSACRSVSSSAETLTSISGWPIMRPIGAPSPCGSIAATSARSGSSATARHTSWPIRPDAPRTPTLIMRGRSGANHGALPPPPPRRHRSRRMRPARTGRSPTASWTARVRALPRGARPPA